jgi:hypothetical protein
VRGRKINCLKDRSDTNAIGEISYPDYQYYRKNNHVCTDIAAAPNSLDGLSDFKAARSTCLQDRFPRTTSL